MTGTFNTPILELVPKKLNIKISNNSLKNRFNVTSICAIGLKREL